MVRGLLLLVLAEARAALGVAALARDPTAGTAHQHRRRASLLQQQPQKT